MSHCLSKVKRLYELGHFYNPKYPNCHNVELSDLLNLKLSDQVVKDAIASFQDMMGQAFDVLSVQHYGRLGTVNGELNAATEELFEIPRCGHPDYFHPEKKALFGKIGSGSWPEPCQKKGITFSIDRGAMPSKYKDSFDSLILKPVVDTYAKVGAKLIPHNGTGQANIRVWWTLLPGSTIGIAQFNSQSCSDSVTCRLDSSFGPNEATEADLLCHEMGHNMNLNHTRGGIMNPSLSNKTTFDGWTSSDPSWNTLVRFFGGEPVDNPDPNPGPNPDPVLGKYNFDIAGGHKILVDFPARDLIVTYSNGKIKRYVFLSNDII